ncbi:hypothetical protein BC828DRAFT_391292 [Blastocladiella britannica]|nr:hypothetical protein BC828DRAFT_391292 [Blastocladiella britannica]
MTAAASPSAAATPAPAAFAASTKKPLAAIADLPANSIQYLVGGDGAGSGTIRVSLHPSSDHGSGLPTVIDIVAHAFAPTTTTDEPSKSTSGAKKIKDPTDEHQDAGRIQLAAEWNSRNKSATRETPAPCRFALPSFLLYDARGLQLFDAITKLPENCYYLTEAEREILTTGGAADVLAATHACPGAVILELGCGSMTKTKAILDAIERMVRALPTEAERNAYAANPVRFYALDLDHSELEKSLVSLFANPPSGCEKWQYVSIHGLVGTYDLGMAALSAPIGPFAAAPARVVLWLGSSVGNLTRSDAAEFLARLRSHLDPRTDRLVIGIDGRNDPVVVARAYNDPWGVTRDFELNLITHINTHLAHEGHELFPGDAFEYAPVYNEAAGRHEAYLRATRQVSWTAPAVEGTPADVTFAAGELIHIEHSVKYSEAEVATLLRNSGWVKEQVWEDAEHMYRLALVEPAPLEFLTPATTTIEATKLPTVAEWAQVWHAFDRLVLGYVRPEALLERPIGVRLPFIFYVGHLPCFMDVQLSRALGEPKTAPEWYGQIFERGMDPDLDDPTQCHPHSEVPNEWPALADILAYRDRTRSRAKSLLLQCAKDANLRARISSTLHMAFEHDVMHFETLVYMVLQLDPAMLDQSVFRHALLDGDAATALDAAAELRAPATQVVLGRPRPTLDQIARSVASFGWDNEFPATAPQEVATFMAKTRPVSVSEYALFLEATQAYKHATIASALAPAGWRYDSSSGTGAGWQVLSHAHGATWLSVATNEHGIGNWPAIVSKVLAESYCQWYSAHHAASTAGNGPIWRLPTEPELRVLLDSDLLATAAAAEVVEPQARTLSPRPMGAIEMPGNVWEWTSTVFAGHPGFEPDPNYPGYSSDFFDGKHFTVLGGSWATHPRLIARTTFRNWYQGGYPYAQIGFRMVASRC